MSESRPGGYKHGMTVSAIDPVGSGTPAVWAALSPFLNGTVRRTPGTQPAGSGPPPLLPVPASTPLLAPDPPVAAALAAAPASPAGSTTAATPATATDTTTATGAATTAPQPNDATGAPANFVLQGESGLQIQSWGAVALLGGPAALSNLTQPIRSAVPAVDPVTGPAALHVVDAFA